MWHVACASNDDGKTASLSPEDSDAIFQPRNPSNGDHRRRASDETADATAAYGLECSMRLRLCWASESRLIFAAEAPREYRRFI